MDSYAIYAQWCYDTHHPIPTREQWDAWCAATRRDEYRSKDDLEINCERREGWGYDPL